MTARTRSWLVLGAACLFLLLAVHGEAVRAPFVSDDFAHVAGVLGPDGCDNVVASLHDTWYGIGPPWNYRPLAVLTFAIDGWLFGTHATGWHVWNLLAFLAAALLLGALTARFFSPLAGIAAALLFAAHAGHAEALGWISHRGGPLANALGLLAIVLACGRVRGAERPAPRAGWAALSFALALTAKETAVTFAPFLFALPWLAARRGGRSLRAAALDALRVAAPSFAVLAIYFVFRLLRFGTIGTGVPLSGSGASGADVLHHLASNVFRFFSLALVPAGESLLGPAHATATALLLAAALVPVVLALLAGTAPRRIAGTIALGAGMALALLGPIAFVSADPASLANTRFLPAASLPFCAVLGVLWAESLGRPRAAAVRVLFLLALACSTLVGAVQSGAFVLAARDLDVVRDASIRSSDLFYAALARSRTTGEPAPPGAPLIVLVDPPRRGPAAFALNNASLGMLRAPFHAPNLAVTVLDLDQVRLARDLLESQISLERGWVLVPRAPAEPAGAGDTGPRCALADRLRRWERHGVGEPLLLPRPALLPPFESTLAVALHDTEGAARARLDAGPDAYRVAAVEVRAPAAADGPARLRFRGSRGSGSVPLDLENGGALVSTAGDPRWLAAGTLQELALETAGPDAAPPGAGAALVLLDRLPRLRVHPAGGEILVLDVEGDAVFTSLTVLVLPTFTWPLREAFPMPQPSKRAHLVFEGATLRVDGRERRTALDLRSARAMAAGEPMRVIVEARRRSGGEERLIAASDVLLVR